MNLAQVVELRKEGYAWSRIAKKVGASIHQVRRAWNTAGLPQDRSYCSRRRRTKATPEKVTKALELRASGMRWKNIAKTLHVSLYAIQSAVYLAQDIEEPPAEVRAALELRNQGVAWKVIGRMLDTDPVKLADQARRFKYIAERNAAIRAEHLIYRPQELHQR